MLHRFSVFVAVLAFLLVVAGGLVTSNDAAGAIPDWPLSWGRLVPPWEGGIRYAFVHRVLAAAVAAGTFLMALGLRTALAWAVAWLVLAQAVLGGIGVLLVLPDIVSVVHACLAQLIFGLVVIVAALSAPAAREQARRPTLQVATAIFLFIQTILGAAVRHHMMSAVPHMAGAVLAILLVIWATVPVMLDHMREAGLLLGLTAFQVALGLGAWAARSVEAPQPLPLMVWFTVAHVAVGSLAFGAAIVLALVVYWHPHEESELQGGTAIA
jgi:cytochrome c oxidase assembly protein subunit 15